MRKNIQKIKNKSLLLQLCVLAVLIIGFLFSSAAPSTFAVSADIELEISGIECDLAAIYGNSEPSTVAVPPYCSNQPQFTVPDEPALNMPVTPSFSGLLLESKVAQPLQLQGTGFNGQIGGGSILIDNGSKLKNTDFVTETLLVAIIGAISIVTALFASSSLFFKNPDKN